MVRQKSVQCIAHTKLGPRCKNRTIVRFPFCWRHTESVLGLSVTKSSISGGGMGLKAKKKFKKNDIIAEYTGDQISIADAAKSKSKYIACYGGKCIDAGNATKSSVARYANDCRSGNKRSGECKGNNAKLTYHVRNGVLKVRLKALRTIVEGKEIFASYGREYWT